MALNGNTIKLRCPECSRHKQVGRARTDLKRAVRVEILCDRCDDGGGFPQTTYWDAEGRELNVATGKPWRRNVINAQTTSPEK